jgi:hypothetical protein
LIGANAVTPPVGDQALQEDELSRVRWLALSKISDDRDQEERPTSSAQSSR